MIRRRLIVPTMLLFCSCRRRCGATAHSAMEYGEAGNVPVGATSDRIGSAGVPRRPSVTAFLLG